MAETRNRAMAKRGGQVAHHNKITSEGLLSAKVVAHYSNINNLPNSGSEGDLAYVSNKHNKYLYIYITHDGDPYTSTGWYSVKIGDAA